MGKLALSVLIFLHAVIHLLGVQKSWNPESLPQLELEVKRFWGLVFLFAATGFAAAGALYVTSSKSWLTFLLLALVSSQVAIFAHFSDAKYGTAVNVVLLGAALISWGGQRFQHETELLVADLTSDARSAVVEDELSPETTPLPDPVARYLTLVLPDDARAVEGVVIEQSGEFNTSLTKPAWHPFRATHRATTRPPGFVWSADVRLFPGVSVLVHDSLVAGRGRVAPWIFGAIPLGLVEDRGGEVTRGEFLRFLAEAPWYPTALEKLPGLSWHPIDERSARVSLTRGDTTASLLMGFDEQYRLVEVRCDDRPRLENGKSIPTPWVGRWSHYEKRDGMLIPLRGEVAWVIDGREIPYWRGRVDSIRFED